MRLVTIAFVLASAWGCGGVTEPPSAGPTSTRYEDLVALFHDWRAFQRPSLIDGVPDYGAAAMGRQHDALASYRERLAAIDPAAWPITRQADYHIVRAEMNGLDFDHRVLRPWATDPAFYVTVFDSESDQPAREGHYAAGGVELWQHPLPLDDQGRRELADGLGRVPRLLDQARANLTGAKRDLWIFGTGRIRGQSAALDAFARRLAGDEAEVARLAAEARAATDAFADWLDLQAPSKTEPSGIGIGHYDWYLRHVQLLPYTWRDEVALMERELARAHAALAFAEHRNRELPAQAVVSSAADHAQRFAAAVGEYMRFLADRDILTVTSDMEPALLARIGSFTAGPREFFTEVDYRDPVVMRTHGYHWFDKAWMRRETPESPMRAVPLLYNIFISRTEGLATAWEEMMMQAGLFDARPRSRELIAILVAQRAARALGDLRMHANQATLDEAAAFTSAHTPRGWLSLDGRLVRGEQHLYLRQPAYGTSYLIGKIQIERLIADRRRQLGDAFTLRRFMDELNAAGLIPISLIRWELTGELPPDLAPVLAAGPTDAIR